MRRHPARRAGRLERGSISTGPVWPPSQEGPVSCRRCICMLFGTWRARRGGRPAALPSRRRLCPPGHCAAGAALSAGCSSAAAVLAALTAALIRPARGALNLQPSRTLRRRPTPGWLDCSQHLPQPARACWRACRTCHMLAHAGWPAVEAKYKACAPSHLAAQCPAPELWGALQGRTCAALQSPGCRSCARGCSSSGSAAWPAGPAARRPGPAPASSPAHHWPRSVRCADAQRPLSAPQRQPRQHRLRGAPVERGGMHPQGPARVTGSHTGGAAGRHLQEAVPALCAGSQLRHSPARGSNAQALRARSCQPALAWRRGGGLLRAGAGS